jgi:hypothetical protein
MAMLSIIGFHARLSVPSKNAGTDQSAAKATPAVNELVQERDEAMFHECTPKALVYFTSIT